MPASDRPTVGAAQRPRWWQSRILAVVLAVALAVALFSAFIVTRESDLGEGTPVPRADVVATPTELPVAATPSGDIERWPAGSLPALLAIAPDTLEDAENGLPVQATYANLTAWLDRAGVDGNDATVEELERSLEPLPLPEVLETRGLSDEWRAMYGFDLRQVDQVLAVGHAPNQILIMPGRYDADELLNTWTANGYQAVEVEETTVWSLFPGDRIDLSAPASRPALGSMNTVALLEDGTIIATARQSRMAEALRAVQGGDSLLDNARLRDVAVLDEVVAAPSVVVASGHLLQEPPSPETIPVAAASPVTAGTAVAMQGVPAVDLVVFAMGTPSDGSAGSVTMTMVYQDPPDGIEAIPGLLEERAVEDDAWSGRYLLEDVVVTGPDNDMVQARIVPRNGAGNELALVEDRDLGPFTWVSAE